MDYLSSGPCLRIGWRRYTVYTENTSNFTELSVSHKAKTCLRDMCGQRRSRSDCADAQSDQGLCCPLTSSLGRTECINGKQGPQR